MIASNFLRNVSMSRYLHLCTKTHKFVVYSITGTVTIEIELVEFPTHLSQRGHLAVIKFKDFECRPVLYNCKHIIL